MDNAVIPHAAFVRCAHLLQAAVDRTAPGYMILLVGLSGAGKTRVKTACLRRIAGERAKWGTGRLPIVHAYVQRTDRMNFNQKDLAQRLFDELRCPALDWMHDNAGSADPDEALANDDLQKVAAYWAKFGRQLTGPGYWRSLEKMIRARHCRWIALDEGAQLQFDWTRVATNPLEVFKGLLESTSTSLLVCGTPKICEVWHRCPEIVRRTTFVYIPRYRKHIESEVEGFQDMLASMARAYFVESARCIEKSAALIHSVTFGVFGEALQMLNRASVIAEAAGRTSISASDLEDSVPSLEAMRALHDSVAYFDSISSPADASRFASRPSEA